MCIFALSENRIYVRVNTSILTTSLSKIGSTENGTVRESDFLAAIRNRLYLCNAFEIQVQNLEY